MVSIRLDQPEVKMLTELLAHGLFGRKVNQPKEGLNWEALLDLAARHNLTPLLGPGLRQISGVPADVLVQVRMAAAKVLAVHEQIMWAQDELLQLLDGQGIPCAVIKGASAARFYPRCELRAMGDIDLLVLEKDYDRACRVMEEAGYTLLSRQYKHNVYEKDDLCIEIHRHASAYPDTPKGRYTQELMAQAVARGQMGKLNEYYFPVLATPDQLISLLAHLERHLSKSGIGLRQFCDFAVTLHACRDQIDDDVLNLLDHCGLRRLAAVVTAVCERQLGLEHFRFSEEADPELADELFAQVLISGDFQEATDEDALSGALVDPYRKRTSLLAAYRDSVRRKMRDDYPWAKSCLWVPVFAVYLPVWWAAQVLLGKRQRANLFQAYRNAQDKQALVRALKLYQ